MYKSFEGRRFIAIKIKNTSRVFSFPRSPRSSNLLDTSLKRLKLEIIKLLSVTAIIVNCESLGHAARWQFKYSSARTLESSRRRVGKLGDRWKKNFFFFSRETNSHARLKWLNQSIEVIERSNKKRNEKWSNTRDKNSIRCINIIAMIFIRRLQIIFRVIFDDRIEIRGTD